MDQELIKIMTTWGPFAVLFTALFIYELKQNSKRETKYQEIIAQNQVVTEKLADKVAAIPPRLDAIDKNLDYIKDELRG